ncbi:MAG: hypothetical protein ACR5K7_01275 [Symbiopectobacterium sp.]
MKAVWVRRAKQFGIRFTPPLTVFTLTRQIALGGPNWSQRLRLHCFLVVYHQAL